LLLAMLLAGSVSVSVLAAKPPGLLDGFRQAQLIIETAASRCLLLDIYLADSREQRTRGLMFVEHLDEFEGMLFRYPRAARLTMWMKNTYIPLDMIFVDASGAIAGIAKDTKPLSTDRIYSPESVTGVLEVNGGFTDRWQVNAGHRLLLIE
jgi:uncharacterized membrane protein (UPF0127 family)